ncbi:albumin 2-like isoform X10 [Erpetoichthys calabaricus]|uniref:Serum albumin 1-like n=1 Tax=Erpetoichthys calabaricus TaxID=27687 RepID=A0A8C4SLB3_ERPCA|nr:albumin 2-like isoform X10 [Erpetoichthys calabaricus]
MKWATLISFVILISAHFGKSDTNRLCEHFTEVKEEGFKAFVLVALSQNLHESGYEELVLLTREITTAAGACCGENPSADCSKNEAELFQSAICASNEIVNKNNLEDCCAKTGDERHQCFMERKKSIPRHKEVKKTYSAKEKCEAFKDNRLAYTGAFIYKFSRMHVMMHPRIIIEFAWKIGALTEECCAQENLDTCFYEKGRPVRNHIASVTAQSESLCAISKKYGERVIKAKKVAQYSQKLPQATADEIADITQKITSSVFTCCSGDSLKCTKKREQIIEGICVRDDIVSRTKHLAECCKLSNMERGYCIENMEPDEKPADLSEKVESYIKDADVCDKFAAGKDLFIGGFLYEYARRHPELSNQMLLRIAKGYEDELTKCCATENPPECYGKADEKLHAAMQDNLSYFQKMCAFVNTEGKAAYEKLMVIRYTSIMPTASFEGIRTITYRMGGIMQECCAKDQSKLMSCAEEKLSDLLDETCAENDPATINKNVEACCNDFYSHRRLCILNMKPDTESAPPEFSAESFPITEALCTMSDKDSLTASVKLLYEVVRLKPTVTMEQIKTLTDGFNALKAKCCADENKQQCFETERAAFINTSKGLLTA